MAPPPSAERGEAQNGNERGSESGRKKGVVGRDDWDKERTARGRERRTERKQVGGRTKKRDIGMSSSCKWWHSVCCNESTRNENIFYYYFFYKKKKKGGDETAPGLLWHGDEHPTLSLCQSCSIPRPWQQLLATSSSCVKSAYVLMNVSAPQSCHCCVRFNSPLSAEILPQVYQLTHYACRQVFRLE